MGVTNPLKPEPTGWFKWILTIIFLAFSLKYGYTAFQVTAMICMMGILSIIAWFQKEPNEEFREKFLPLLSDNDWVFWAFLVLTVVSGASWYFGLDGKPVVEVNPLDFIWGTIKTAVEEPVYDPYKCMGLRGMFFECEGSWGSVFWSSLFWTAVAWPVSFVDNWLEAKHTAKLLKAFLKAQADGGGKPGPKHHP